MCITPKPIESCSACGIARRIMTFNVNFIKHKHPKIEFCYRNKFMKSVINDV